MVLAGSMTEVDDDFADCARAGGFDNFVELGACCLFCAAGVVLSCVSQGSDGLVGGFLGSLNSHLLENLDLIDGECEPDLQHDVLDIDRGQDGNENEDYNRDRSAVKPQCFS